MAFAESALKMQKISPGTVVALLNPKQMPAHDKGATSYCIESPEAVLAIGSSEDYDVCRAINTATPCYQFLNKSIEKICDNHKLAA